jgi:hypothetical protein
MTYRRKPMNRTNSENKLISESAEQLEDSVFNNNQRTHIHHSKEVNQVKSSKLYHVKVSIFFLYFLRNHRIVCRTY